MNFQLVDILKERCDADVLAMFNSQWGYLTCGEGGVQCVYCTRCRLFAEDFSFDELSLLQNNVNLMKASSIGAIADLRLLLPFENGISHVVYTTVQAVNKQVKIFIWLMMVKMIYGVDLMDGRNMSHVTDVGVGSDEDFDQF